MIVSDDRALVGTLNLDAFALYRNPEMGLRFDDKAVADRFVSTLFEPDIAMSTPGSRGERAVPAGAQPALREGQLRLLAAAAAIVCR